MGDDPMHQDGVRRIPPQGEPQADGEATSAKEGRRVEIPPSGGRDGGGGTVGGGDLSLPPTKHSRKVHFNQDHYGPVSSGGAETAAMSLQAVVRAGQIGCGGCADGGLVGGTGGGRGRDR